jgi:hypothetical protein
MTLRQNLSFTRKCIGEAVQSGVVEIHAKATSALTPPAERARAWKTKRLAAVTMALVSLPLLSAGMALADACGQTNAGGTDAIVSLFKTVGTIIIAIGGAAFLVTLGIGALMIMGSGGNTQRADKGMKWIKNSIIGVGLLAFGIFIRSIVVHVVANMTSAVSTSNPDSAAPATGTNGFDPAACIDQSKYGNAK